MVTKGILINAKIYEKKDNKGKGLSLDVLVDYKDINDMSSGKVINLYAGNQYIGDYDISGYKRFDEINIIYNQPIGCEYVQLVNIEKVTKK